MVEIRRRNHLYDNLVKLIIENKGLYFIFAGDKVLKIFFYIDENLGFFSIDFTFECHNRRFRNGDEEK